MNLKEIIEKNGIGALATMQRADTESLMGWMANHLPRMAAVYKFAELNCAKEEDIEPFLRGVAIGSALTIMGAYRDDLTNVGEDIQCIVARMTSRKIDLFTGGELV